MVTLKVFPLTLTAVFFSISLSDALWQDEEEAGQTRTVVDYVHGSIWPKPQVYNATGKVFSLASSEFSFDSIGETSDVLTEAIKRYRGLVFPDDIEKPKAGLPQITKLTVNVEEKYTPLSIESDESCKLNRSFTSR